MSTTICEGCGRRASSGEDTCAACGRSLGAPGGSTPAGWGTTELDVNEPLVRPMAPALPTDDVHTDDVSQLFRPASSRRAPGSLEPGAAPGGTLEPEPVANGAGPRLADLPGGAGWRVRVSAAQAALAEADERSAAAAGPKPPLHARLPRWVYPMLIVAILATSAAAALLIALHVAHGG